MLELFGKSLAHRDSIEGLFNYELNSLIEKCTEDAIASEDTCTTESDEKTSSENCKTPESVEKDSLDDSCKSPEVLEKDSLEDNCKATAVTVENPLDKYIYLAESKNDTQAMARLGYSYQAGLGCTSDITLALKWYLGAAKNGDVRSMVNLGGLYYNAERLRNVDTAIQWFTIAFERGSYVAAYNLGCIYCSSANPAHQDYNLGFKYFSYAAEAETVSAMNNLGCMYLRGCGTKQNYSKGKKWISRAAKRSCSAASYNLGIMYMNGLGVTKSFAKSQRFFEKSNQDRKECESKLSAEERDSSKLLLISSLHTYTI